MINSLPYHYLSLSLFLSFFLCLCLSLSLFHDMDFTSHDTVFYLIMLLPN